MALKPTLLGPSSPTTATRMTGSVTCAKVASKVSATIFTDSLRDCRKIKFLTFGSMRIFIYR